MSKNRHHTHTLTLVLDSEQGIKDVKVINKRRAWLKQHEKAAKERQ